MAENLCMVIRVCTEKETSSQKLKEFIGLAAPINTSSSEKQTWLSPVYMSVPLISLCSTCQREKV
jgi:hypothetical protein